jgi:hypothetical protein
MRYDVSQADGFLENLFSNVRADGGFGEDVYLAMEKVLQILLDGDDVEQAPTGIKLHEKVNVALRPGLTASRRAK